MNFFKTIISLFSKKQKYLFFFIIFFTICSNILQIFGLTAIIPLITILSSGEKILEIEIFRKIYNFLDINSLEEFKYFLFYLSIFGITISTFFSLCSTYLNSYFSTKFGEILEQKIFKYYIQEDYVYFSKNNVSTLISKIANDIPRIRSQIIANFIGLIINFSMLVIIAISILYVDFLVSFITIFGLSLFYLLFFITVKKITLRHGERIGIYNFKKTKSILDSLNNIKYLKFIDNENFYINAHKFNSKKLANTFIKNSIITSFPKVIMEFTFFIGTVILCLYLSNRYGDFSNFLPLLTLFAVASIKALPAINQVFLTVIGLRTHANALYSFKEEFDKLKFQDTSNDNDNDNLDIIRNIKLDNISFKYSSGNFSIENVSLEIKKNQFVGFCGTTGSGKTTIVDIISGLISPTKGSLIIDGKFMSKNKLNSYRKIIGYVPQEIFLGNMTIKESIALGYDVDNLDLSRIEYCAKLADIHSFIITLNDGYETFVGDNGIKLSGGQKQRIGIARALYKNPKILIFDEATSSLDYETEKKIIQTLTSLKGKLTLIMITHRLETIRECDNIFLISKGKVAAQGFFKDLERTEGLFKNHFNS
jgi:ATP-binding cassette, subfamily B, bacterial PglK